MRKQLRDGQWKRLEALLLGKVGDRGRSGADNRLFVEAVLWIARAPAVPGAICRRSLGCGTARTSALRAGRAPGSGPGLRRFGQGAAISRGVH